VGIRIWNVSAELGRPTSILVQGKLLQPGESIVVPVSLWERLRTLEALRDSAPKQKA